MMNGMQVPQIKEFHNTDKVMRFIVGDDVSDDSSNGATPSALSTTIAWPTWRDAVDKEFNFQMGGADTWTINGVDFTDPNSRVLARAPQGSVQRWRFRHTGGLAVHPVHIHLVNMQVISRTGGVRGLLPYEAAGLKDVVMLAPGETVEVLAVYGPWNGMYMFHCHNLIHEDHTMMAAFNTTRLRELGYEYESTQGFGDPMDARFTAQDYSTAAFTDAARRSAVRSFAALEAYAPVAALQAAQAAYFASGGYQGGGEATRVVDDGSTLRTAAPVSAGVGFASKGAKPTSTALFTQ